MPAKIRPNPAIPDHEVLRKIGGGAYGEVWLARGVTGALRAVKVVWREDFEDERSFEREFEGILKFEPISRDHPGLVHILHVGRSPDGKSFYYYVMEIGDDVRTGHDINPVEYEARTLRADLPQSSSEAWDVNDCIEVGLRLAEALDHLHSHGLAHRDVKPSNVIFVQGRAKLADIGLVAARGQRTFVGTEGFVPPEGPGSTQADVYSLGKVLYELATGKDRLSFPELPDEIPSGTDRKRWLQLNRVVCEVCEPRVSKRKITTAAELAEALRRIQRGKRHRSGTTSVWLTTLMLFGVSGWIGWELLKESDWLRSPLGGLPARPQAAPPGRLRVFSFPEGADVIDSNGVVIGTTPTSTLTAKVGEELVFTLRKPGFRSLEIRGTIPPEAVAEPATFSGQLQVFCPPVQGQPWSDQLGNLYVPIEGRHESVSFLPLSSWTLFAKSGKTPVAQPEILQWQEPGRALSDVVLCSRETANAYCGWLRSSGIKAGFLTDAHEVSPLWDESFSHPLLSDRARQENLRPFRISIRSVVFASLAITSNPPGAEVYVNGQAIGTTQGELSIPNLKPGRIQLLLVLGGYKPLDRTIILKEGESLRESLTLVKNQSVVFGREWTNGLGMKFVPIHKDLMGSAWETRVADYAAFCKETKRSTPSPPPFQQTPDHPVVSVSRDDARAFCRWLTERDQRAGLLAPNHLYRLPTDLEWSLMAGIEEDVSLSPGARDMRKQRIFPWGSEWPGARKVGNFADMAAARDAKLPEERTIVGYDDGFAYTAPVGSFPANPLGLFDLSGNAQEWVDDAYSKLATEPLGVLRGGGWNTSQIENLYTGSRNGVPPDYRDSFYGFRVVLGSESPKTDD